MNDLTVAIYGLGLIGGSLARDLHALGFRVLGYDADPATLESAREEGTVRGVVGADGEGMGEADVVVLAVPVPVAPALLTRIAPHVQGTLVTDTTSTKRGIVEAAVAAGLGERFVGAHPFAGDHRVGWTASRQGLFLGCTAFLCPTPHTELAAVERAVELWRDVGARTRVLDAAEHDSRMAWLSHLPQAAASALALALAQSGLEARRLGPGGLDATRLAASSPGLWAGILLDNADAVEPTLSALERSVGAMLEAVRHRDVAAVERLLSSAKRWKSGE
jgi:prephenate dehydrogenase